MAYAADPRIDQDLTFEPERTIFSGDIVNVYTKDSTFDGETKTRIAIGVRDWDKSEGRERPFIRWSRLPFTTGKKSNFTRLIRQVGKTLGVDIKRASDLLGLEADWVLEDIGKGQYVSSDVLGVEAKASLERPADLPEYVAKETAEGGDEPEDAASPEPAAEVSDAARDAFLALLPQDKPFTEADARKIAVKASDFRTQFPVAFAAVVSGQLVTDLANRGKLHNDNGAYTVA